MKNDLIVFTSLFGDKFHKLYQAPVKDNSFVFTNNQKLKSECELKGWNFIYLDVEIPNFITSSYQRSNLQSKYVKFLKVVKDFPDLFNDKNHALYFDHKFEVKKNHIRDLLDIKRKGLIIRETPRFKNTVYDEIQDAMRQARYRERMPELKNWVKNKLLEGYSPDVRICNTGLMLYDLSNQKVLDLCSEVYLATMEVLNPECQVIWCILSQKYKDHIKTLPWDQLLISWRAP
tara:strand:+ start:69 stop:764 length:696 start_codon:yes stop_codon:yes gene_type:complete